MRLPYLRTSGRMEEFKAELTEAARFLKKLEVHSVYSVVKERKFFRGNICIYLKVSWTFSTFLHRCERKPQNVYLKLIFRHVLS